jgi:hypothetical protein
LNLKAFITAGAMIFNSYVFNMSQRWSFRLELPFKLFDGLRSTFYLNPDIFRSVVNPAPEVVSDSQSIDERPEAHALNDAPDAN